MAIVANERDIVHDDAEMLYNRLKSISGVSAKLDVTPKAMHNNFAWSSYFRNDYDHSKVKTGN